MEHGTDVCVVGGGPAGMTLALLLLRSGLRVTVVERSPSLNREYRGEILQPGGLAALDRLGVLDGARERGSYRLDRFRLLERGRVLMAFEYGRLRPPHNQLLSLPQAHLLAELLERCQEHPRFTYLTGRVNGLVRQGGAVRGVHASGHTVLAACVVGADGRHSQVRRLAGIPDGRLDIFDMDVVWFRVPADGRTGEVTVNRTGGNPILAYDSWPDSTQLGWTLPKGGWRTLAAQGVDEVRTRIQAAAPHLADVVGESVRSLADVSLLDVFGALAPTWVADGLVLIGDAAHTHGPLGAQGINVAIQDAVALHPILVAAIGDGDTSAARLSAFERLRRPDVTKVMRFQGVQSRLMLAPDGLAAALRPRIARVMMRTPLGTKFTHQIAYGNPRIDVADHLFTAGVGV